MSKKVYANGNEVSAKKDGNKSMGSMPDVCLSPPSPPAGPVPIPYPNNTDASRTTDGSKTVKIGGAEVGLKNKSKYKNSNGDEAATKSLGMGVVSHNIQGYLQHVAWSMDVKFEGYNVIRHMDMVTQNHLNPGNTPGMDLAGMAPPAGDPECVELEAAAREAASEDGKGADPKASPPKRGRLPRNDALVTAKHSPSGQTFKAVQPGTDWVRSDKASGYSQPHDKQNITCLEQSDQVRNHQYSTNTQGNRDHSECKIMEDLFAGNPTPGGSLTMRINWNRRGRLSNKPCGQCMGAICKTAQECGIDIFICTGKADNLKKKPAPCDTVYHKTGERSHVWSASVW